ncbi:MAG: sigma-70 family RNA polymerase sigma factor [Akkermansiaceae bacterium]
MDDSFLIRKYCSKGDGDAATKLLKRYERALYQFIWQMLYQQQDCEDAMQETFRKALKALPDYREENHFKSWLFRIGRNEAVEIIRRRRRTIVAEAPEEYLGGGDEADSVPGVRELMEEKESIQALVKAIALLPQKEREVVAMRTQGELSFKEIAGIVGAPIGTVLARMHAAKKRLKSLLNTELDR